MGHAVINRFKALDEAFRARAGRGERLYARFAALAALSAPHDIESLIERCFEVRTRLNEGLGNWRSPNRPMRLVFAAALVAAERNARNFFEVRTALGERRSERGARTLSQGGSCAALSLTAAGGQLHNVDDFFDILETTASPWWRREASREEVLAAAFAALGQTPDEARQNIERAKLALMTAGVPRQNAEAAAYEVALLDPEPGKLAGAWTTLNVAVRGRTALRHGLGKTGLAVLAAHGEGPVIVDSLVHSFEAVRALRPRATGQVAARLAMRLTQAQCGSRAPVAAAGDLAAILAAQAAMVTAVAASSAAAGAAVASG